MKTAIKVNSAYYRKLVRDTRTFGSCYLHADAPATFSENGIQYHVNAYGRSHIGGGHKYKAYAMRDGKPVSSKELFGVADLRNR